MSGFEIAGLALGAIPIALSSLDGYRKLATKARLFNTIRVEYTKCEKELKFHQLAIKHHLRQLLMPILSFDDGQVGLLLADPGGDGWRDVHITRLLLERLGADSFDLYMDHTNGVVEITTSLRDVLALDNDVVQTALETPLPRARDGLNRDNASFLRYRAKFANGETTRRRLFDDLTALNGKLDRLLGSSDKDAELVQKRAAARNASAADSALCTFWRTATTLFRALAAACSCQCQDLHAAELLLRHRVAAARNTNPDFHIQIITEAKGAGQPWAIHRTRILEAEANEAPAMQGVTAAPPSPRKATVTVSIATPKLAVRPQARSGASPKPKARFLETVTPSRAPSPEPLRPITALCKSLGEPESRTCHGYLSLRDEDRRYQVFSVSRHAYVPASVTLAQILQDAKPAPSRTQRYAIALIVASSFLQLHDSPWLPTRQSFEKQSIVFHKDSASPDVFPLDQPHIRRGFQSLSAPDDSSKTPFLVAQTTTLSDSLTRLGITLLELCFGSTLESQPCRTQLDNGDRFRELFDAAAAGEWLKGVHGEAGPDYSAAVSWCLMGNRSIPTDRWREEMLREVVAPLQRSLEYLAGQGAAASTKTSGGMINDRRDMWQL